MMDYRSYKKSRNLSWDVLIHEGIKELPVDIVKLCRQMGVQVKHFVPMDDNDGKCMILLNSPRIFVSMNATPERQRFTIAHELGHILLGHVGKYELVNREPSPKDNPIEQEANVFASRLLAPACVLWGLNIREAEEIAQLCRISITAAQFRAERMAILYERNKFLTSPLERKVYNQFEEFIQEKRKL